MNKVKLTDFELADLRWFSQQTGPMWGGLYDRANEIALFNLGLIERIPGELRVGRAVFPGGFRITPAGRAALEASNE